MEPISSSRYFWDTEPRATGFTTTGVLSLMIYSYHYWWWCLGTRCSRVIFSGLGNVGYELGGGQNYNASGGAQYKANLGDLTAGYDLFENEDEVDMIS